MKILVCGYTSFASQGLPRLLRAAGHDVVCFGRGPVGITSQSPVDSPAEFTWASPANVGPVVTGPVDQLHTNPHLQTPFDAVVNYILLKDETISRNEAFAQSLTEFCRRQNVRHLVHISSVSSYKGSVTLINEDAPLETDPTAKGSYGSLKVASDLQVAQGLGAGVRLSMIRPGFIFGQGLIDPIIGTGARLPWNRLLLIGNARTRFPVTTRDLLHQAVLKVLCDPPAEQTESLLLVAPNSPTRLEYLRAVASRLGAGMSVASYPVFLWRILAIGSEAVAWVIGQRTLRPYSKLSSKLQFQTFDSSRTQKRLGMDLSVDWAQALEPSLDAQPRNFVLPYRWSEWTAATSIEARQITFLGFGRIVQQRHLPALKQLHYSGAVTGFDTHPRAQSPGQDVRQIAGATLEPADLFIVATPGPAHAEAIQRLRSAPGTVLLEKPLCYREQELRDFEQFAAARPSPVLVCHNYRYKRNVAQMMALLETHNPGRLHDVDVDFSSPPVSNDSAAWLRDERTARTLLMDYALHFIDLACMFSQTPWQLSNLRFERNTRGQTSLIQGAANAGYSVHFLLRQGFAPRRARLRFTFQNYSVSLGFFPDTFVPYMASDNAWLYKQEAKVVARATRRKVFDKLRHKDSDPSHGKVFALAADAATAAASALTVARVRNFYDLLFRISEAVYGP